MSEATQQVVTMMEQVVQAILSKQTEQNASLAQMFHEMQTAQSNQVKHLTETLQHSYPVQNDVSVRPMVSKMAEADPKFPCWDGNPTSLLTWIVRVSDIAQAREMSDAVSIRYARLALGDFARGHFPAGTTFVDLELFLLT